MVGVLGEDLVDQGESLVDVAGICRVLGLVEEVLDLAVDLLLALPSLLDATGGLLVGGVDQEDP